MWRYRGRPIGAGFDSMQMQWNCGWRESFASTTEPVGRAPPAPRGSRLDCSPKLLPTDRLTILAKVRAGPVVAGAAHQNLNAAHFLPADGFHHVSHLGQP